MFAQESREREPLRWYRLADARELYTTLHDVPDNRPLLPTLGPAAPPLLRRYTPMSSADVPASWMGRAAAGAAIPQGASAAATSRAVSYGGAGSYGGTVSYGGAGNAGGAAGAGGAGPGGATSFTLPPHLQRHQHLMTPWASFSSADTVMRPPATGPPSMPPFPHHQAAQQQARQQQTQQPMQPQQPPYHSEGYGEGYWQRRPPHQSMQSLGGASGVHPALAMEPSAAGNDVGSRSHAAAAGGGMGATHIAHVPPPLPAPPPSPPAEAAAVAAAAATAWQATEPGQQAATRPAAAGHVGQSHPSRPAAHLANHVGSMAVGEPPASPHGGDLTPAAAMAAVAALEFGSAVILDEQGGAIARPHLTGAEIAPPPAPWPMVPPRPAAPNYFSWDGDPYYGQQQLQVQQQGLRPYHERQGPVAPMQQMAGSGARIGDYYGGSYGTYAGPIPPDADSITAIQQWLLLVPDHSKTALAKAWRMSLRRATAAAGPVAADAGDIGSLRSDRRYYSRRGPTVLWQQPAAAAPAASTPRPVVERLRRAPQQPIAVATGGGVQHTSTYYYRQVGDNLTPELVLQYTNQLYGEEWDTQPELQTDTPLAKLLLAGQRPWHVMQTAPSAAGTHGGAMASSVLGGNGSATTQANGTLRLYKMYNQLLGQAPAKSGQQQQPQSTASATAPRAPPLARLPVMPDLKAFVAQQQAAAAVAMDPPPAPAHELQRYVPKAAVWQAAWAAQRDVERSLVLMGAMSDRTAVYAAGEQQQTVRRVVRMANGGNVDAFGGTAEEDQVQALQQAVSRAPRWRDRRHMESVLAPVFLVDLDSIKVAVTFFHGNGRSEAQTQTGRRGSVLVRADSDEASSQHSSAAGSGSSMSAGSSARSLHTSDEDMEAASTVSGSVVSDSGRRGHASPGRLRRLLRSMNPFHWWQRKDGAKTQRPAGRSYGARSQRSRRRAAAAGTEDGYSSDGGSFEDDQQRDGSEEAAEYGKDATAAGDSPVGDPTDEPAGGAAPTAKSNTSKEAKKEKEKAATKRGAKASMARHPHGSSAARQHRSSRKADTPQQKQRASTPPAGAKRAKEQQHRAKAPAQKPVAKAQGARARRKASAAASDDGSDEDAGSNADLAGQEGVESVEEDAPSDDDHDQRRALKQQKVKISRAAKQGKQQRKVEDSGRATASTARKEKKRSGGMAFKKLLGVSSQRKPITANSATAAAGYDEEKDNSNDDAASEAGPTVGVESAAQEDGLSDDGSHKRTMQASATTSKNHAKSQQLSKDLLSKLKFWKRTGGSSKPGAARSARPPAADDPDLEGSDEERQQSEQEQADLEATAAGSNDSILQASNASPRRKQQAGKPKQQQKAGATKAGAVKAGAAKAATANAGAIKPKAVKKADNKKVQDTTDMAKDNTVGTPDAADSDDDDDPAAPAAATSPAGGADEDGGGRDVETGSQLPAAASSGNAAPSGKAAGKGAGWLYNFRKGLGLLPPAQQRISGTQAAPPVVSVAAREPKGKQSKEEGALATTSATSPSGEAVAEPAAGKADKSGPADGPSDLSNSNDSAAGKAAGTSAASAKRGKQKQPTISEEPEEKPAMGDVGPEDKPGTQQGGVQPSGATAKPAKQPKSSLGNRLAKIFFGSYPTPAPPAEPAGTADDSVLEFGPQEVSPRTAANKPAAGGKEKADADKPDDNEPAAGASPTRSPSKRAAAQPSAPAVGSASVETLDPGGNSEIEAMESGPQEESPKAGSTSPSAKGKSSKGSGKKAGAKKIGKKKSPAASTAALPPPQGPKAKLMQKLLKLSDVVNAQRAAANTTSPRDDDTAGEGAAVEAIPADGGSPAKAAAANSVPPSTKRRPAGAEKEESDDGEGEVEQQQAADNSTAGVSTRGKSGALERLKNTLATNRAKKGQPAAGTSKSQKAGPHSDAAAADGGDGDGGNPPASPPLDPVMWGTQRAAAQEVLQRTARSDTGSQASQHGGSGKGTSMMERMMASLRRPKHQTEVQEMVTFKEVQEPKGFGGSTTASPLGGGAQRGAEGPPPYGGVVVATPSTPIYKGAAGGSPAQQKGPVTVTMPSSPAGPSRLNSTTRSDLSATTARRRATAHGSENLMTSIRDQQPPRGPVEQQDRTSPDPATDQAAASPAGGWAVQSARSVQSGGGPGGGGGGGSTPGSPLMQSLMKSTMNKTATLVKGQDVAPSPAASSLLASLQEEIEEEGSGDDGEAGGAGASGTGGGTNGRSRAKSSAAAMASQLADLGLPPSKW